MYMDMFWRQINAALFCLYAVFYSTLYIFQIELHTRHHKELCFYIHSSWGKMQAFKNSPDNC